MNIINKLTLRHLKKNKKRTIVTIIGIVISVAMVTAAATLTTSFISALQENAMEQTGEWHVVYNDVNKDQIESIKQDENIKAMSLANDVGAALLEGEQNRSKPYLFVKEYNEQAYNQFPFQLLAGRFPKADNEVVISKDLVTNSGGKYEIGDHFTIEVGERFVIDESGEEPLDQMVPLQRTDGVNIETLKNTQLKTYTIVGEIESPSWDTTLSTPGYMIISYLDEKSLITNKEVDAYIVLNKVSQSLYDTSSSLAIKNNIKADKIQYNTHLLNYYGVTGKGNLRMTIFASEIIIITVIVVGSVALIYNAFTISIAERARYLGMLSSVGATKIQKRNSVLFEAAIVGFISIPIGMITGVIGVIITLSIINTYIQQSLNIGEKLLTLTVTPVSMLVAIGVSLITIFISCYLPARKASKVSAIDAIRQTQDVKLTGKEIKTSKIVRNLFGIQAEIGLKNVKRNKKRYDITIFSFVVSIILFITVSFFTDNLQKSIELSQRNVNYDIQVTNINEDTTMLKSLSTLDNVTSASIVKTMHLYSWIDDNIVPDDSEKWIGPTNKKEGGKILYRVDLNVLDEDSFIEYAKSINVDPEKLKNSDQLKVILIDTFKHLDEKTQQVIEEKSIYVQPDMKIGLIDKVFGTGKQAGETFINSVQIAAVTDQYPMGDITIDFLEFEIVMPESLVEQLFPSSYVQDFFTDLYLTSSDPMTTYTEIEELNDANFSIYSSHVEQKQNKQLMLLIKAFSYGFTILITVISVANIFNTISTSIALRKREFAMLKSIGMTSKEFNKMINYESIFYGIKSLLYGLPISIVIIYAIHRAMMNTSKLDFTIPWMDMMFVIIAIFLIVVGAMLYSSAKVKKENIIDALKMENI
ncbi:FtsX-like permease family protein [Cytobacillus sp. IB215665]|uniref:FtsX-like permease family protein n=1 Tax=Cytobacillus sp. IB215665 TaxID=3097357 RepID=UPI002A0E10A5|nr:FtsX-like permease family protein [Cytobacillus sp. IB215665]MDX8366362.1 FtsX-like permease family protein [Cytobacillus sp. IB215665]